MFGMIASYHGMIYGTSRQAFALGRAGYLPLILGEVLDHFDLDGLEASEHDILDGAALEAAQLPEPEEGAAPPGAYTCC